MSLSMSAGSSTNSVSCLGTAKNSKGFVEQPPSNPVLATPLEDLDTFKKRMGLGMGGLAEDVFVAVNSLPGTSPDYESKTGRAGIENTVLVTSLCLLFTTTVNNVRLSLILPGRSQYVHACVSCSCRFFTQHPALVITGTRTNFRRPQTTCHGTQQALRVHGNTYGGLEHV